jgi:hypothetical protein
MRGATVRFRQDALAFLFRAAEAPTLPLCPARHDDRTAPALNRAERIRTIHEIETQFDQVGERRGVTRAAQLLHRPSGHGCAQLRITHGPETKKASSAGLRRLVRES